MLVPEERTNQQKAGDDHRYVREQAELYKLRKVFAVKSKSATIKRANTFALRAQRTRKRKSSRRSLRWILRERRHHHTRNTLRNLVNTLAQIRRSLLAMGAHDRGRIAPKWRLARKHLVSNHAETVDIGTSGDVTTAT